MMRSLFSGVAGLKTHQTRMDVIGNNIANVNTVAYKSQSATFQELMYQNTQNASAANQETGRGGINAKQIGLGSSLAAINTNIALSGSSQTTGNAFDVQISGDAFFIVSDGSQNHFTRAGAFYVDGVGNLAMTSNGYNVMGWQPNADGTDIQIDTVSPLKIMSAENMVSSPEQTTRAYVDGVIDKNDSNVLNQTTGRLVNVSIYDSLGYSYIAQFGISSEMKDDTATTYWVKYDTDGTTVLDTSLTEKSGYTKVTDGDAITIYKDADTGNKTAEQYKTTVNYYTRKAYDYEADGVTPKKDADGNYMYKVPEELEYNLSRDIEPTDDPNNAWQYNGVDKVDVFIDATGKEFIAAPGEDTSSYTKAQNTKIKVPVDGKYTIACKKLIDSEGNDRMADGTVKMELSGSDIEFNTTTGAIKTPQIGDDKTANYTLTINGIPAFANGITIDFANLKMYDNNGTSTVAGHYGDVSGNFTGRKKGALSGVAIQQDGKIFGSYDNGTTKLLGQIAVASFANPSGLEKIGDNLYDTTQNSGAFDGIGKDITADGGGSLKTGVLEMSNVDLSSEFTEMITTQRGFQANSRIITVSDTMLEELINLKR